MPQADKPTYARRLSGMERYGLMFHSVCRYHVDGVVEGVGDLGLEALRDAVFRAAEANPGLRVRLCGSLGFSRWVDSGIAPRVRLVERCPWTGMNDAGAEFLEERLEVLQGGPVAEVVLVRCLDEKTRIVFRTVHAAVDGRGLLLWMRDVFMALRGEQPVGSGSTLTDMDVQHRHRDKLKASGHQVLAPAACLPILRAGPSAEPLTYVWRRVALKGDVPNLLTKTAVFLADWARRGGPGEVRFTVPVDYRGLRTHEIGTGNLTGYLKLSVSETDTSRNLMVQLNRLVRGFADCFQPREMPVIRWLPISFLEKKLREKIETLLFKPNPEFPSGGIVSMGKLNNEWYSCDGFRSERAYGIPGFVGQLNVVFINFDDATHVTFAVPSPYNDEGQLDEMIRSYEEKFSI